MQDKAIQLQPANVFIKAIIKSCVELMHQNASDKQIRIELDCADDQLAWCDEVSMHTVFRNLISNAIKFSPIGGLIRISVSSDDVFTKVDIADNGVGMSDETIDKIFNQNMHHTTTGTKNEQGTGLGLMLVKDFIKKNNAMLNVSSVPNEGTVFSIKMLNKKS